MLSDGKARGTALQELLFTCVDAEPDVGTAAASAGFDFGRIAAVGRVRFHALQTSSGLFPKFFRVEYKVALGDAWSKAALTHWDGGAVAYEVDDGEATGGEGWHGAAFGIVRARWFRLVLWGVDGAVAVSELEMYGYLPTADWFDAPGSEPSVALRQVKGTPDLEFAVNGHGVIAEDFFAGCDATPAAGALPA